ncbi:MAG: PorV/PorQ family protein [Candidatus Coatesbacteria bacterium]
MAAGPAAALSRGEAGADFLKIAAGVRAVAMGGSYTAVGEDIYSVYWNPAGTANLTAPEGAFSYVKLYQSDQITGVYLVTGAVEFPGQPFGFGNGGAGFMALATGSFDSTDPQALVRAAAGDASDLMGFVTYSAPLTESIAVGASLKVIRRSLTGADPASYRTDPVTGDSVPTRSVDFQAGGLGADVGVLWENLDRTMAAGASVQNMGAIGGFGQGFGFALGAGEILPVTFRLGGVLRTPLWGSQLLTTADLTSFIDSVGRPRLSLGAEYGVAGIAFVRAGWEQPLDQRFGKTALDYGNSSGLAKLPSPLRTGLGFRWKVSPTALVQLDYALAPFGTLGSVHQVAMLVRWSIPRIPKAVTTEAPVSIDKRAVKPALVIEPKTIRFEQPPKEWKVEITDDRGRVVKTFAGTGLPPKSLNWDGADERGRIVTDVSKFRFVLKAKDVANRESSSASSIASVSAEPQIRPVAGKPFYPEVAFALPQGNYQLWQLQILDAGRIVRTWQGQGTPDTPIRWDGRDAEGRMTALKAPKFSWKFQDEDGQTTKGERPIPQVEAEVRPELLGNRVRMVGVRYTGTASELTDEHRLVLQKAAAFIAEHPGSSLAIEAFSDVPGGDDVNYELAKARAERVLRALVEEYRLEASRVSLRVYGRSRPAPRYPNLPEEEQRQRVDLVINVRR